MVRKWVLKCKDDSETANWLIVNTKMCPKCRSSIQKSGGCNHMVCKLCQFEFCWVCSEEWKRHGQGTGGYYSCNRFDAEKSKKTTSDATKTNLERYLHYYHRYSNHEQSKKIEDKLRLATEEKMKRMQEEGETVTYLDVQYLQQATEQLCSCRHVLQYTYVVGFYLPEGPAKTLFELNQAELEGATEKLSRELEMPQVSKMAVLNAMGSAKNQLAHLLKEQDKAGDE